MTINITCENCFWQLSQTYFFLKVYLSIVFLILYILDFYWQKSIFLIISNIYYVRFFFEILFNILVSKYCHSFSWFFWDTYIIQVFAYFKKTGKSLFILRRFLNIGLQDEITTLWAWNCLSSQTNVISHISLSVCNSYQHALTFLAKLVSQNP